MKYQELYHGFIRLHILHHAAERPVYGVWIMAELARHGYRLSPGTLYPTLHGLERKGYLRSGVERDGKQTRRTYTITAAGRTALAGAKSKLRELFAELFEKKVRTVFDEPRAKRKAGP